MRPPLILGTTSYGYLVEALAASSGFERAEVEVRTFPDGERYHRVVTSLAGRDVILVGGTIADADTLELYDLATAIVKEGARGLDLVIPYFGYATMERAVKPGEVVTAKTRARLLSTIPLAPAGNRVYFLDLHAEGIPHYLEGGIVPIHIYAKPIVARAAGRLGEGKHEFVLACTDAGRAKWVESLANDLGVQAAFIFKRRRDGAHTEVVAVSAYVEGKDVVIYDDMIRTGGSLIGAAKAYRAAGARRMWTIATHGVLPGDALERLEGSGLFESIITTDSHPRARQLAGRFLTVEPIAELIGSHLRARLGEHA